MTNYGDVTGPRWVGGANTETVGDVRGTLVAAANRLTAGGDPGSNEPIMRALTRILEDGVEAVDARSGELSALHYVYRMARVIVGPEGSK